jgi:hypothetical protein
MKASITPTEKKEELLQNLKKRLEKAENDGEQIKVEVEEREELERIPGVDTYTVEGEEGEGLKGTPVHREAYIKIHSKEDLVEAFLATVSGYSLLVTECSREWELKLLKRFNPSIKEVSEPSEVFQVDEAVNLEDYSQVEFDYSEEEKEMVYDKIVS